MPAYIAHVACSITLRLTVNAWDESDAGAVAEDLAMAILKGQFDRQELHGAEVTCTDLIDLDPDQQEGVCPEGPQG